MNKYKSVLRCIVAFFAAMLFILGVSPLAAETSQSNSVKGIWYATTNGSWHYKIGNPAKWECEIPRIVSSYTSTVMLLSAKTVIKNGNARQFVTFPRAIKEDTAYVLQNQPHRPRKSITEIVVRFIPHNEQRYNTVGDWYFSKNANKIRMNNNGSVLVLTISIYPTWQFGAYTGLHELAESLLCSAAGITPETVDDFDLNYEGDGEPGGEPDAPYYLQHVFSAGIEEDICNVVSGPDAWWGAYDEEYWMLTDSYEE